jgi:hypothetical protein
MVPILGTLMIFNILALSCPRSNCFMWRHKGYNVGSPGVNLGVSEDVRPWMQRGGI